MAMTRVTRPKLSRESLAACNIFVEEDPETLPSHVLNCVSDILDFECTVIDVLEKKVSKELIRKQRAKRQRAKRQRTKEQQANEQQADEQQADRQQANGQQATDSGPTDSGPASSSPFPKRAAPLNKRFIVLNII